MKTAARRRALLGAWVAALVTLPGAAAGQGLGRFVAPMGADDLAGTERAQLSPHLGIGGYVAGRGVTALRGTAVRDQGSLYVAAQLGLWDRVQLGVGLPVVLTQTGAEAGLGDARVDLRVRLAGPLRGGFVRLVGAVGVGLPVGAPAAASTDGGVTVFPRVTLEMVNGRDYLLALNLGALLGGDTGRVVVRAGVTVPVVRRVVVTAEAGVHGPFADLTQSSTWSLETLLGLRWMSRGGLVAAAAAGPGLTDAVGTASLRAVVTLGYAPQPPDPPAGVGDADFDSVPDPDDQCPDVPMGPRPDPRRRGCPLEDRDRDGYADRVDQCPDTPAGEDPDPRRMGCPLADQDHDGVRDPDDLCPVDAAGRFPDPARRGCPNPDIDGDGIPNDRDACPEEPGPRTQDPATHGCPRVFVTADRVVIQQQPRFAVDRAEILPESAPLLSEVAAALEAHPELVRVEVQGHTDNSGSDEHNVVLSRRRAESIRQWLVTRGVAPERLEARGYGSTVPLADNTTRAGRALNRRVEFVVRARATPSGP